MKEEYVKPELIAKPYAQFENVFAKCSKTPGKGCDAVTSCWPPRHSSYSSHQHMGGNPHGKY